MYRRESPTYQPGVCTDIAEIRALTSAVQELRAVDPLGCAAMGALGSGMRVRCEGLKAAQSTDTCPLVADLQRLTSYVKDRTAQRLEVAVERGWTFRRFPLGHEQEAVAAQVDMATAEAYFLFARASGRSPDYMRQVPGSCGYITLILQQTLLRRGVVTTLRQFEGDAFGHYFLVAEQDGLLIDATWQQFLRDNAVVDYSILPHTMILPTSQLTEGLQAHDIPNYYYEAWMRAMPCEVSCYDQGDPRVIAIFEAEGWANPS